MIIDRFFTSRVEDRDRLWIMLLLWHDEIIATEQLTRVVIFCFDCPHTVECIECTIHVILEWLMVRSTWLLNG